MENWLRPMKDGYPVMLQELLSRGKASGEAPIVLNAGVGSMTSNLVASLVVNRIVHFHPKVVVIKAGYNDVYALCRRKIDSFDYAGYFISPFVLPSSAPQYIDAAKAGYRGKTRLAAYLRQMHGLSYGWDHASFSEMTAETCRTNLPLYRDHVRAIVGALRSNHIRPVLLDLPGPFDDADEKRFMKVGGIRFWMAFTREMNGVLRDIGDKEKVPFIEVQKHLRKEDFWDHAHLERSGNRKTAEALRETVARSIQ